MRVRVVFKSKVLLVLFFAAIVLGIGITTAQAIRLPERSYLMGMLFSNMSSNFSTLDSKSSVESEMVQDWDEIMAPILTENQSVNDRLTTINNGFKEWLMKKFIPSINNNNNKAGEQATLVMQGVMQKKATNTNFASRLNVETENIDVAGRTLRNLLLYRNMEEAREMLVSQFLSENPKYQNYVGEYVDMISEIHRSMVPTLSQPLCDMIVEKGKLTDQWEYNTTVNSTMFTVTCNLYELSINGTVQRLVKANFYNQEGVQIMDPYAGVWIFPIPIYIWPFGWMIIGEDLFFNVRFTYPVETIAWYAMAINGIHGGQTYNNFFNMLFPPTVSYIVLIKEMPKIVAVIVPGLTTLFATLGLYLIPNEEANYLAARTNYAFVMSSYDSFGIQCQLYVHFIYPWTVFGFLTSYFTVGYVLFNGVFVQALPNPYTYYVPVITVAGLLGYVVYSSWLLVSLRNDIWTWAAFFGMYRMVWFGTWPTE